MEGYEYRFISTGDEDDYSITRIPFRKRVALCRVTDSGVSYTPIAYFKAEEEAALFAKFIEGAINRCR